MLSSINYIYFYQCMATFGIFKCQNSLCTADDFGVLGLEDTLKVKLTKTLAVFAILIRIVRDYDIANIANEITEI